MLKNSLSDGNRRFNMFDGDTDTQVWARDALPVLVKRVQKRKTIEFSELTKALGLQGPFYKVLMGKVCAHISTTLAELKQRENWNGEIPRITTIVLKKGNKSSPHICELFTGDKTKQPSVEQLHAELENIFNYTKWNAVLDTLSLR